jgi:hypothetical protein
MSLAYWFRLAYLYPYTLYQLAFWKDTCLHLTLKKLGNLQGRLFEELGPV